MRAPLRKMYAALGEERATHKILMHFVSLCLKRERVKRRERETGKERKKRERRRGNAPGIDIREYVLGMAKKKRREKKVQVLRNLVCGIQ